MSIQAMEKSQEYHPGFVIGSDILITMVDITAMDHLVRINGVGVGHRHGYRKNGMGRNSLE